jgi:hypothetical protein
MADVLYFQKKLLQSMNVPYSRLDPQGGGMVGLGRTTEVTRDELKFNKFVNKLRNKFTQLFDNALRIQLSLKGICTLEEWEEFKEFINYDFKKDNNFTELKESELLKERINTLNMIDPYVGRYFSAEWVKKKVLMLTDEEIEEMQKQIDQEGPREDLEQPDQQGQPQEEEQAASEQFPPEDNISDRDSEESETPELDAQVQKYSKQPVTESRFKSNDSMKRFNGSDKL